MPQFGGDTDSETREYFKNSRHDEAIRQLKLKLANDPQDWKSRLLLAEAYHLVSRGSKALKDLASREFMAVMGAIPQGYEAHNACISAADRMDLLDMLVDYYARKSLEDKFFEPLLQDAGIRRGSSLPTRISRIKPRIPSILLALTVIAASAAIIPRLLRPNPQVITCATGAREGFFTADGTGLISASGDAITFINIPSGNTGWSISTPGLSQFLVSIDGKYLLSTAKHGTDVTIIQSGEHLWGTLNPGWIYAIVYSGPSSNDLKHYGIDLVVANTREIVCSFREKQDGTAWSADGKFVAVYAGRYGTISVHDGNTGAETKRLFAPLRVHHTLELSPDGVNLAASRRQYGIVIYDTRTGNTRFENRDRAVHCSAFNFDGSCLAAPAMDPPEILLIDVGRQEISGKLAVNSRQLAVNSRQDPNEGRITGVTFSPDNTKLALFYGKEILIYTNRKNWQ